ncbi:MAG: hypothetical protein NTV86_19130 [Planctomycetota bacterium]|nr:hypothetical protein [Planctomycetota bacterium]
MLTTSRKKALVGILVALAAVWAGTLVARAQEGGEGAGEAATQPAAKADAPATEAATQPAAPEEPKAEAATQPGAPEEPKGETATQPAAGGTEEPATATSRPEGGAEEPKADERKKGPAAQWDDLLDYIKVAQTNLALDNAKALLGSGASPKEIYVLAKNRPDSMETLSRGKGQSKELAEAIVRLQRVISDGFYSMRQDPDEIAESIRMLGGSMRQYTLGAGRLKLSGEFCLPQLIQKLADESTPAALRDRIVTVLPELGGPAVNGLSAALDCPNPVVQQAAAAALGKIQYRHAAAALHALIDLNAKRDPDNAGKRFILPTTLATAKAAFLACMGNDPAALKKTTSELYYDQAERYYAGNESMKPDRQYETANVWHWDPALGLLSFTPVPTEIFCDVYAMRMARLALQHDPKNSPAVSLWLAAYLKKEADLGAGKKDPTQKDGAPTAKFYTLASSPSYVKEVVVRGLRDKNTPVIIGALKALTETNGSQSILKPLAGGDEPVVASLTYADRRVRFLAAVALADAQPRQRFSGAGQVMMVLNEALHQTGMKVGVVIAQNGELRAKLKDAVRAAGWNVLDESDPAKALTAARETPGVDAVIVGEVGMLSQVVPMLRKDAAFAMTPVVMAGAGQELQQAAEVDKRIVVISPEITAAGVKEGMEKALEITGGAPLALPEARKWAVQAATSIRGLGLSHNAAYDVQVCRRGLIDALDRTTQGEVQTAAADALSVMSGAECQRAIVDAACKGAVLPTVRIACFNAAAESVRRLGNLGTEEQAEKVIAVVNGKDSLAIREAAAKFLGALDLPSEKIKDLVLQDPR